MSIFFKNCGETKNLSGDAVTNYTLIQRLQCQIDELAVNDFYKVVESKEDLPTPLNGVITFEDYVTYYVVTDVDLEGDRIVCGLNNVILGFSSENCSLTSTGLNAPLITSTNTIVIRHITFRDVDTVFDIHDVNQTTALDWTGVNTLNVSNIGTFNNFSNFILNKCAFLNSQGIVIDGAFGSFVMVDCILTSTGQAGSLVRVEPTATVQRRIRIEDSAVILLGQTDGFNVSTGSTISSETYILDTVNFNNLGSGDTLVGLDYSSDKALFQNCAGIINSSKFGQYSETDNPLETVINSNNVPVKINTNSVASPLNQKFEVNGNRLTYTSGKQGFFEVKCTLSATSENNNRLFSFYIAKNGVVIPSSKTEVTTASNNRTESVSIFTPVLMSENDYVEIWVENNTDASNITITTINTMITKISL
jgi:hypothetical protein